MDEFGGEKSIAELYRRQGIAQSIYNNWPKEFLEAGKYRLTREGSGSLCGRGDRSSP